MGTTAVPSSMSGTSRPMIASTVSASVPKLCGSQNVAKPSSAARRAAPVSAVHHQVVRAGARFDLAQTSAERAQQAAAGVHPGPLDLDQLRQVSAQVRDSVAEARAMLPVAAETADLAARVASLEADETALLARTARLQAEVVSLPASVEVAAAQVETARSALEGLPHAGERVEALVARLSARRRVTELSTRLDQARDVLRASVDTHQIQREQWLELHESRLNGMAAEIAVALAVGGSCPVCGSCDHPAPATPTLGAPTAAEEKAARRRADDADVTRQAHADQVRSLETSLAVAREQAGTVDAAQLELEAASARSTTAHLQSLADGLPAVVATLDRARLALQRAEADLASARVAQGSLTTALTSDRERLELLSGSLTELLGDHRDLRALIDTRERHATVLTAALEALSARDRASTQLDEVTADLRRVAAECGFEDPDAAVAAHLPEAELTKLEAAVSAHDAACAAARAQLDDATLAVAATLPPPELDSLAAAHAAAADALAEAEATHRAAVEAAGRLEALRTQLFDALDAWAPVRDAYDLAARVSGFAEGKAGDNQAQMRLSAYVLSWRLGQVVDAANVRLARMTDQRYALEHTARKGAGETRGGLSLLVRDDWSGETRDPVTLSGGETFVVSLALALGLTDVVTQEAGGADIGTLFVDEGFGSLDADTLDDVMDTLDALRDGGRVVGIVSHVPELRTRIPAQLQVDKSRSGSRVRQVHLLT